MTRRTVLGAGASLVLPSSLSRAAAGNAAGFTDTEIILGMSAAFSGPSRGLGIELYRGAFAYFNHVNRAGGIGGRKIVLRTYDDGYQPDPCVENTVKLIQKDRVFALFGYVGTPTVTRVLPLLKKFQGDETFLFFPFTGAQPQRQPPYGEFAFNLRASYRQETEGLVDNFVSVGRKRIGMFYQADAYGRSGWAGVRRALRKYDLKIVGEATYRRGQKFTSVMRRQAQILKNARADAVICIGAYAACAAFLRDAVDNGLRVPIANLSFVGSENLLKLIAESQDEPRRYTELLVNSQVVPSYEDATIPAVREYRELMQRYNPQPPKELLKEAYTPFAHSFVSLEGFLDAKLMVEILRRMGDSPERGKLENAVFSVKDFDLGVGVPVTFSADRRQGLDRVYYTVVDGGRFVPLDDWKGRF
ncbi:MAG: ABC transporter substrate-binding protein [Rhodospirillaceae bacterium]|nr:ABC transporter substrate-binding protein [Rhodospirillaceae bacterium]